MTPPQDGSAAIVDILDGKVAPGLTPPGGEALPPPPPDFEEGEDDDAPLPPLPPLDPGTNAQTLAYCATLEQNDTDNGGRMLAHFGEDILHVREVGWHVWDGRIWERKGGERAVQVLAQRTAKRIHHESQHIDLQEWESEFLRRAEPLRAKDRKGLTKAERTRLDQADEIRDGLGKRRNARRKFAVTSGNSGRIAAMVDQALPHKEVDTLEIDSDPMLFNCENGTLRFTKIEDPDNPGDANPNYCLNVENLPHDRAHRITKMAPVVYDPAAKAPRFLAFMQRFQPKEKIRKFIQVYHGLALTGMTGHQCFVLNHGTGANGKSTLMETVSALVGPYADLLNAESLTGSGQRRGDQATPDFADLPGVRFLCVSELPRGEPLKEALVKALTGGEKIKARHLNEGFFSFKPCFKAAMSGNDLPKIGGVDNGIWRRVRLVPWEVTLADAEQRPMDEILAEFAEERSGILNWLIEGLDLYMREGLQTPDEVRLATAEFRAEMDPISSFTNDCLERVDGHFETARAVYQAFETWCLANSVRPWKETAFGLAMPHKGFVRENTRVRRYINVRLHDVPERPADARSPMSDGGYA